MKEGGGANASPDLSVVKSWLLLNVLFLKSIIFTVAIRMSNPTRAPRVAITAPLFPDGMFDTGGKSLVEINEEVKKGWGISEMAKMLGRKLGVTLMPAVRMKPAVESKMVFNEGASKRLLAITQDSPLQFRLRSLEATSVKNVIIGTLPVSAREVNPVSKFVMHQRNYNLYSQADAIDRTSKYFMVAGGTQWAMGRLEKALPEASIRRLRPATGPEADQAYHNCGFYHGSSIWQGLRTNPFDMDGYLQIWPLVREGGAEGHAVTINKSASLGHPYYAKADDEGALSRCLQMVRWMESTWKGNAGQKYREALIRTPNAVLFVGKTKTDIYSAEKIKAQQLRFYVVTPGHLKLYLAQATQPFAGAKTTLLDIFSQYYPDGVLTGRPGSAHPSVDGDFRKFVFDETTDPRRTHTPVGGLLRWLCNFHSAQKVGMSGAVPELMVRCIDAQLVRDGIGYLHCGDDTTFHIMTHEPLEDEHGNVVLTNVLKTFGTDESNFDLTQRRDVFEAVHAKLFAGLCEVDGDRAQVMLEIWKKKLINVHGSCVALFENMAAAGIPLQSEVNDMVQEILCLRIKEKVLARSVTRVIDGRLSHQISWTVLEIIVREAGEELALSVRMEDMQSNVAYTKANESVPGEFYAPLFTIMTGGLMSFKFLGYNFRGTIDELGQQTMPADNHHARGVDYPVAGGVTFPGNTHWETVFPYAGETEGRIEVTCDLPRALVNMLYPTSPWIKGDRQFKMYNSMRILSTLMCWGSPGRLGQYTAEGTHDFSRLYSAIVRRCVAQITANASESERAVAGDGNGRSEAAQDFMESLQDQLEQWVFADVDIVRRDGPEEPIDEAHAHIFGSNCLVAAPPSEEEQRDRVVCLMMDRIHGIWHPDKRWRKRAYDEIAEEGEEGSLDPVVEPIMDMARDMPSHLLVAIESANSGGLQGLAAQQVLIESTRVGWADEMDEVAQRTEGLMANVVARGPPVLPAGLRPITAANFGRPPPNMPVTNPTNPLGLPGGRNPVGGGGGGGDGAGQGKTAKKRAQRQRKKARENRAAREVEEAGAHYAAEREVEQMELDYEEEIRRAIRNEEQQDRAARGGV